MIQRSSEGLQIPARAEEAPRQLSPSPERDWREALAKARRSPIELAALLALDPTELSAGAAADFPLVVPDAYLQRIRKGDPRDPLLLQVLPVAAELDAVDGFTTDPLAELESSPLPGIVQRFHGRVLLTASPTCGINCRYCFRRHYPYGERTPTRGQWLMIFEYVRDDTSIAEVILSGGDPLVLGDRQLGRILAQFEAIDHVRRIRIHSRIPVVIPQRVSPELLALLDRCTKPIVMVIHSNHARELSGEVAAHLARLRDAGVTLLNQSVLLRGVNDSVATLSELSEALFSAGVQPYYLHLLDRIAGAAHFDVDEERAAALHRELEAALPGYLVPRLVRDAAGASAKRRPGATKGP